MLLFKSVDFIVGAASLDSANVLSFMLSIVGGIASIIAAIYFFNIISDQASGAREAMQQATQNMQDAGRSLQENIEKFERDTGVKVPR
ncbi:hypothetical protein [Thiobacillus denitrificans]|nr:hypothetical protein [Thiobacillus denitrificans]